MGEPGSARHRATLRCVFGALALLAGTLPAQAADVFKCGGTFQDRPCDSGAVQQRFSRTEGTFAIEQVNPDTDKDCARAARDAMRWWQRLMAGESLESVMADPEVQKIGRYERSRLRDNVTAMREYRGAATNVRSQFESQCMAYKRRHGLPTEREVASGAATLANDGPAPTPTESRGYAHSRAASLRAEAAARRAAAAAARER